VLYSNRLKNIRILLVDDERLILRLVTDVLSHLGFTSVTVCHSGTEAAEKIRTDLFDIVITDWRMPDMQGIDLIRFIRNSPESPCQRIPIILLTGNTGTNYIFEARDAGVTEYMIKPFSAQQLVRRIKAIIERPKSYVEAPTYRGPNRRFHDIGTPEGVERRKPRG